MSQIRKVELGTFVTSPDAVQQLRDRDHKGRERRHDADARDPRDLHDTVEIQAAGEPGADGTAAYDVPVPGRETGTSPAGDDDEGRLHIDIAV